MHVKFVFVAAILAAGMFASAASAASKCETSTCDNGNVVTVAQQVTDPSYSGAWGGFIDAGGNPAAQANIGDTIQVLVTSIQTSPDPFAGTGTFSVSYDPTQLTLVGESADGLVGCDVSTPGVVTCPESGLENATAPDGKSDGFFFTVIGSAGGSDTVTATVNIDCSNGGTISASADFALQIPAAEVPLVPLIPLVPVAAVVPESPNADAFCYGPGADSYAWITPQQYDVYVITGAWANHAVANVTAGVDSSGVMVNGMTPTCLAGTSTGRFVDNQGWWTVDGLTVFGSDTNPNGTKTVPEHYQVVTIP